MRDGLRRRALPARLVRALPAGAAHPGTAGRPRRVPRLPAQARSAARVPHPPHRPRLPRRRPPAGRGGAGRGPARGRREDRRRGRGRRRSARIAVTTAILGGIFDPPHNGHVALARAALADLPVDRLVVLVAASPGHRGTVASAEERLRLARAAFAELPAEVELDENAFTADAVRGGRFGDAYFVVGADEGADFPSWKEPDEVLRWVRLAVGTRSGYPPPDLERYGDRVVSFQVESPQVSSSEVRERVADGEPVTGLVPEAVAREIEVSGLYRGYTGRKQERT